MSLEEANSQLSFRSFLALNFCERHPMSASTYRLRIQTFTVIHLSYAAALRKSAAPSPILSPHSPFMPSSLVGSADSCFIIPLCLATLPSCVIPSLNVLGACIVFFSFTVIWIDTSSVTYLQICMCLCCAVLCIGSSWLRHEGVFVALNIKSV